MALAGGRPASEAPRVPATVSKLWREAYGTPEAWERERHGYWRHGVLESREPISAPPTPFPGMARLESKLAVIGWRFER